MKVGFLGFNTKDKTATIWDTGKGAWSGSNLKTIGVALVNLLSDSNVSSTANKYVYISSHTVTHNELLEAFERLTGEKWAVTHIDSKKSIAEAHEKLAKHDYSAIAPLIQGAAFSDDAYGDFRKVPGGLWNERLGLTKENLDADLKALL
jgi:hypothetical protein